MSIVGVRDVWIHFGRCSPTQSVFLLQYVLLLAPELGDKAGSRLVFFTSCSALRSALANAWASAGSDSVGSKISPFSRGLVCLTSVSRYTGSS